MFTGIIEEVGEILSKKKSQGVVWTIKAGFSKEIKRGDSISIEGACHTVRDFDESSFSVFSSPETLEITGLDRLQEGHPVNLERAALLGDRLGGHLVYGHIDQTSRVLRRTQGKESWLFLFELPPTTKPYLIPKGSITINGVSLTIYRLGSLDFQVMIIPHTLRHTTFSALQEGDLVRLEYDPISKMVERQLKWRL